ncbi:MAG TPA: 50S ribosomal protein L5 [Candidatus Saccharimonadales bacterium]|jgi:large subunit ribosomal protein L5|nr:50S ribosomal protein L5 [Candidatus Saccharimonadales bacterium]
MVTKTSTPKPTSVYTARLAKLYNEQLAKQLMDELKLSNRHEVPRLEKVVLNVGLGRAKDDKKIIETATNTLRKVTGQQPVQTTAKKSIANFKLREGNKIGIKVTLRGNQMYEFTDRLVNLVLPRLRDFHGVSEKAFDKSGNYSIGLVDQSVFPELTFEETSPTHGLQAIFVVKSKTPDHSRALLTKLGFPFEKGEQNG